MKKTQLKDASRNILKQLVSFISIALVIALGVGIFLACRFSSEALANKADSYYKTVAYHNLEIKSTQGMTDEDIENVVSIDGVSDAEGLFSLDMLILTKSGQEKIVHIITKTDKFDTATFGEGGEPKTENECAIASDLADSMGIKVGDEITLIAKTGDESFLKGDTFVVSGIMQHPDHYRKFLVETFNVMLSPDAIDSEKLGGMEYTSILVKYDGDINTFSDEYEALSTAVISQVNDMGKVRMHERYTEYVDTANKQIADGEKQLAEAKEKLDDAKETIKEGEEKLADANKQIADAEAQIADGEAELESKKAELAEAKRKLEAASAELADAKTRLESGRAELDAAEKDVEPKILVALAEAIDEHWEEEWGEPPVIPSVRRYSEDFTLTMDQMLVKACNIVNLSQENTTKLRLAVESTKKWKEAEEKYNQLWNGEIQYKNGLQAYNDGLAEYNNGLNRYRDGEAQIAEAERTLNESKALLEEKRKEVEAGRKELEEGKAEFEEKEKEYTEGVAAVEDAKVKLSELIEGQWVSMPRSLNLTWMDVRETRRTFDTMALSFAILFVALGALVCYATIGRIINEQRTQIGTTKAVGFFNREILGKYLIFGVLAAVIGVVLGIILAYFLLQKIILNTTSEVFLIGEAKSVFQLMPSILAVVFAVLIACLAVWIAGKKLLKQPARELMNNEVPRTAFKGERKSDSSGASMYRSLIVRNVFSDWRRVLITIASVAGCCALLAIGFALKQSFVEIINRQFSEIIAYDGTVEILPDDVTAKKVEMIIESGKGETLAVYQTGSPIRIGDSLEAAQIICVDPEQIGDYYHINSVYEASGEGDGVIPDEGIVLFKGLANVYGLGIGDTVEVVGSDGSYRKVKVSGIYDSYAGRTAFMSENYAKEIFGDVKPNSYFLKNSENVALDELSNVDGFLGYTDVDDMKIRYEDTSKTMDLVVAISIVMAIIMAAVVLLNLIRIQLNQKRQEMTIMRVNGFTLKETVGYILKENIFTTVVGIVLGLVLGNVVARTTLNTFDRVELQTYKGFMSWAIVFPIIITAVFAILVNIYATKEIKGLQLRDANH